MRLPMLARQAESRLPARPQAALAVLRNVAKPSQERIFAAAKKLGFQRPAVGATLGCKGGFLHENHPAGRAAQALYKIFCKSLTTCETIKKKLIGYDNESNSIWKKHFDKS